MKVLFLEAVQNFGGARKSTVELAQSLQSNGVDCLIVDFWGSCQPFVDEVKERGLKLEILDKRESPIVLSHSNKFKTINNYISYFFKWLKYKKKLAAIIHTSKPDLIVVNNNKTLSLLKKDNSYKIVFFARGWFLPRTISKVNKKMIEDKVSIFVGVSQATRQAIFAGGYTTLDNIYVVQNSFDFKKIDLIRKEIESLTPWYDDPNPRDFRILHCGGFLESKGQMLLIEIAKELKIKNIQFKIIIVGIVYKGQQSEKFYNKLVKLITDLDLNDKFEFVLNQSNALEYFDQCDILVHPTHTEGLPRVTMEAMAFGKPVIGNAVGGMTDYIINHYSGYLVNFNHVNEYVDAITDLYHDKNKYKYISKNSIEIVKKSFNSHNQINDFMKIFNNQNQ